MQVVIRADEAGEGLREARRYAREHVVVPVADMARIRAWAKSKGLLGELRALKVTKQKLTVG